MFDRSDLASLELSLVHTGPIPSLHLPAVEAELAFVVPQPGAKPRILVQPPGAAGGQPYDFPLVRRLVEILDVRPIAAELDLEQNGVALVPSTSAVRDFADDEEVRRRYYPEAEALLRARAGAREVVIFDHTVRIEGGSGRGAREPVRRVHGDYTHASGPRRLRDLLGEARAAEWSRGRWAIVNVWRPFGGPVETTPLAFADPASLSPVDLVPTDLVYPDRVGEVYSLAWSPGQRWMYVPEMVPEEALLIRTYDSDADSPARFVLHSAFDDPQARPGAAPRRSIELRALVRLDGPA